MNNYNESGEEVATEHWTVDKKIPLALIFAIMLQTIAGVWWAATTTARLSVVELSQSRSQDLTERVIRLEVGQQTQTELLKDIRDELKTNATKK